MASAYSARILVALTFVFCINLSYSTPISKQATNRSEFDILIFTQHWPQTVCFEWKEGTSSHTCALPGHEEWTIHGLWPTKYHTIGPSFCNRSKHFDKNAIASLESELSTKWINIESDTPRYSFWRHEWEKHGTCAISMQNLNTEKKYFQQGLRLLDIYDMKNVLGKANIFPGQSYPVQTILNGVKKVLGKRAKIDCITNLTTKESYIFEVGLCFDKGLQLIDCNGIVKFPTNCDRSRNVIYPGIVPPIAVRV